MQDLVEVPRFSTSQEQKDKMDESAAAQLMSRAAWLRQAIKEKLDREAAEIKWVTSR